MIGFRPFTYLRLRDATGGLISRMELIYAALLSFLCSLAVFWFPELDVFSNNGLIAKLGGLAATLTGFYIAALVAVATFSKGDPSMEAPIEVGPILLRQKGGEDESLSRREFVCYLFGYLAFIALALSILSIVITTLAEAFVVPTLEISVSDWEVDGRSALRAVAAFPIFLAGFHMAAVTMRGLYYLVDRLYAKKQEIIPGSGQFTGGGDEGGSNDV